MREPHGRSDDARLIGAPAAGLLAIDLLERDDVGAHARDGAREQPGIARSAVGTRARLEIEAQHPQRPPPARGWWRIVDRSGRSRNLVHVAILLDDARWPAHGTRWAHLVSDASLAELHAFARRAGLPQRSFDLDHYDVPGAWRERLLAAGAQHVSAHELIARLRASGLRVTGAERPARRRAELQHQWVALVPQAPVVGVELLERWSEPHRRYHGLDHLRAILFDLQAVCRATPPRREAVLAAWFHDAVWHGHSPQDEEASAALAERVLGPHLPPATTDEVGRLVRLTAQHTDDLPGLDRHDPAAAMLLDADLAVLGTHPSRYDAYARAVRAEYPSVPDAAFRAGRRRVLEALLARDRLYATAHGRRVWEHRARQNLAAELAGLTG